MLGLGAVVLLALVLPILDPRACSSSACRTTRWRASSPAPAAIRRSSPTANKLAPTDRPDIGYAMIFPGMTIVKILFVDIVPALFP